MENQKFCQSCAMPMGETSEMYGTEKDGSKSHDYCSYCYADGEFTGDMTMQEMIDFCVPGMVEHNEGMTEQTAREMMGQFFPQLKRWNSR